MYNMAIYDDAYACCSLYTHYAEYLPHLLFQFDGLHHIIGFITIIIAGINVSGTAVYFIHLKLRVFDAYQ